MSVDITEEIQWFLRGENTVGALLITGEWGCGKTYFVENELKEIFEDEYAIIRVSLFGADSARVINDKVKRAYMKEKSVLIGESPKQKRKFIKDKEKLMDAFGVVPVLGKVITGISAINWMEFITIENEIDGKPLVLVFDDLERTNMDVIELIGCINECVETYSIKTIVIANEERIERDSKNRYSEYKEKIISKTLRFKPNFAKIVGAIVSGYEESGYKKFLESNSKNIIDVFLHCGNCNIRSMKIAIQEFRRVYEKLLAYKYLSEHISGFFDNFVKLVLNYKASQLDSCFYYNISLLSEKEDDPKLVIWKEIAADAHFVKSLADWVVDGAWVEEKVDMELKFKECAFMPEDRPNYNKYSVVTQRILTVNDKKFSKYFPQILEEEYRGELALDYCIDLIRTIAQARIWGIPLNVDMQKFTVGVEWRIEHIIKGEISDEISTFITEEDLRQMTPEERSVYEKISKLNISAIKRRFDFLESLKNSDKYAVHAIEGYVIDVFDDELQRAFFAYYKEGDNERKVFCARSFLGLLTRVSKGWFDIEAAIPNIENLADNIENIKAEERPIEIAVNRNFAEKLREWIENIKQGTD